MQTQVEKSGYEEMSEEAILAELMSETGGFSDEEIVMVSPELEELLSPEELLLSDDELAMIDSIDVSPEPVKLENLTDEFIESALADVKHQDVLNEIYEEQEADATPDSALVAASASDAPSMSDLIEELAIEADKPVKAKKERKEKEPRKTTFTHSREDLLKDRAKEDFYLLEKANLLLDEEGKKAKHDEVVEMIKGMNVKTGAKCMNLLSSVNDTREMSTFIKSGVRYILSNEPVTRADFIAYFVSAARNGVKAYGMGTATAQVTNLLRLFQDLKMIKPHGAGYILNEESVLVESLASLKV